VRCGEARESFSPMSNERRSRARAGYVRLCVGGVIVPNVLMIRWLADGCAAPPIGMRCGPAAEQSANRVTRRNQPPAMPLAGRSPSGTTTGARRLSCLARSCHGGSDDDQGTYGGGGFRGWHVGTVDHLKDGIRVKLAKSDPDAGGEHHFIPLAWVDHVE